MENGVEQPEKLEENSSSKGIIISLQWFCFNGKNVMCSGDTNNIGDEAEEIGKLKILDPDMGEEQKDQEPIEQSSGTKEEESMMEGAWADILGSGQLKKKVSKTYHPFTKKISLNLSALDPQKRSTKYQTNEQ